MGAIFSSLLYTCSVEATYSSDPNTILFSQGFFWGLLLGAATTLVAVASDIDS